MESLEDIQVGDVVVVCGSGRCETKRVATVSKVTKHHFLLDGSDSKFRKRDGSMISDSHWHFVMASRPEPGEVEEIEADRKARNARGFVQDYIESIRSTPAAFVPIAKFIKENMKPEKDEA